MVNPYLSMVSCRATITSILPLIPQILRAIQLTYQELPKVLGLAMVMVTERWFNAVKGMGESAGMVVVVVELGKSKEEEKVVR